MANRAKANLAISNPFADDDTAIDRGINDILGTLLLEAERETIRIANERGQALLSGVRHMGHLYAICGVLMVSAHTEFMTLDGSTPGGHKSLLAELVEAMRTAPSPRMTLH